MCKLSPSLKDYKKNLTSLNYCQEVMYLLKSS